MANPITLDPTARKLSSSRPADDDARRELVKDLQRELKRVGCYDGEMHGTWTPAVRKAMASFTDRVNATLPLDEPDYILLTLVQGHAAQACGQACPAGQAMNDTGKCLPRAVLAQVPKRGADKLASDEAPSTTVAGAARPRPPAPARVASSWSTVVTAPQQPTVAAPTPQSTRPAQPLPGRMAIGAAPEIVNKPSEIDQLTRTEVARRKAELASTAAAQRDADAETARKARLVEAQARKDRELAALKQQAATRKSSLQTAAVAPVQAPQAAPAEATEAVVAPTTKPEGPTTTPKKAVAKRSVDQETKAKADFVAPVSPAPTPAPRRVVVARPAPYGVGRIASSAPRPAYAPSPSYAPQPTRWTRTIFSDITRMR